MKREELGGRVWGVCRLVCIAKDGKAVEFLIMDEAVAHASSNNPSRFRTWTTSYSFSSIKEWVAPTI